MHPFVCPPGAGAHREKAGPRLRAEFLPRRWLRAVHVGKVVRLRIERLEGPPALRRTPAQEVIEQLLPRSGVEVDSARHDAVHVEEHRVEAEGGFLPAWALTCLALASRCRGGAAPPAAAPRSCMRTPLPHFPNAEHSPRSFAVRPSTAESNGHAPLLHEAGARRSADCASRWTSCSS
jgi:hypothetical protein